MSAFIQQVTVDGADIQQLIFNKLAPACEGEQISHSVLGMLTYITLLMKPDIDLPDLQKIVMDTSEYMIMQLAPAPVGEPN